MIRIFRTSEVLDTNKEKKSKTERSITIRLLTYLIEFLPFLCLSKMLLRINENGFYRGQKVLEPFSNLSSNLQNKALLLLTRIHGSFGFTGVWMSFQSFKLHE